MTFALSSIGGIIVALFLFIVLKRVIGLVFRVILAGILLLAIVIGAWWWSRPSNTSTSGNENNSRPQQTQTQPARRKR